MILNNIWFLCFALVLSFSSCKKHAVDADAPPCLMDKIHTFSKTACEEGVTVTAYTFQGKTVYVFDPGNCGADMASPVLDVACHTIGSFGGITGNTEINGESFSSAIFIKTVWQK